MELTRRDFNRLTASAFSGMLAGAAAGCGGDDDAEQPGAAADATVADGAAPAVTPGDDSAANGDKQPVGGELPEHNACLGLNQCDDYGKKPDEHECAGQGFCATVEHECKGKNTCKYLGACDGKVAANGCKEQGGCQVPMIPGEDLWQQARAAFEKRMQAKGVEVGPAPLSEANE